MGVRAFSRVGTVAIALALVFATAAPAHTLSRARALSAARAKANRLARTKPGETHVHRSPVRCRRSNVHLFLCTTTVSGATLCAASETDCDGPAPFSVPYQIIVRLRGAHLLVVARVN
jgi:hypothetical protein